MKSFVTYALLSAAVATAAVAVATALPLTDDLRSAALLGIGLSGASGGLALVLKRRGLLKNGLKAVMTALTLMFFVRSLLLGLGLWVVVRAGGLELAFVIGFFSVYLLQQTLELLWVVAASKELKGVPAT